MFSFITCFGVVGAIFAVPVALYIAFITVMFVIYKRTGGKLSYWKYLGLW